LKIAFGRSLGGAVAINLAATFPTRVGAVIVENTFTSILDMIDILFPLLSYFKFLSTNVYVFVEFFEMLFFVFFSILCFLYVVWFLYIT
jgi:hypothetical protein